LFEDRTYENILQEFLDMAPPDIDTRQGSVYYDAVAPAAFKLAKFYADLQMTFELVFIDSTEGEFLTEKAKEHGVERLPAKPAKRRVTFEGVIPNTGERFFAEQQYFVLKNDDEIGLYVEAEEPGESANNIPIGTKLVPLNNIFGLTSSTLGEVIEPGTEEESDDDLKRRLREKIAGPAENGNKQHYKTWCEEVVGVGRARIFPLWDGPNTVKGVLVDTQGLPASQTVVDSVQEYVDPGAQGLGEGVANLGAKFTAVAANTYNIDIYFQAVAKQGATLDDVKNEAIEAFTEYFKDITLNTPEGEDMIIRVSAIGNIIYELASVLDYSNLTINGGTANIQIDIESVPVLGVVTVE
jgi:uncharacterized phage protein gp47/JayE